jgi:quercetin dioxygenase-like cupin family protein
MTPGLQKVTVANLAREDLGGGITRAAFANENAMLVWNYLAPGAGVTEPHVHDFDQFALILDGCVTFECDGVEHDVNAGEMLFIPAGVWHRGTANGDRTAVNLDVFAPPRQDYRHLVEWQSDA